MKEGLSLILGSYSLTWYTVASYIPDFLYILRIFQNYFPAKPSQKDKLEYSSTDMAKIFSYNLYDNPNNQGAPWHKHQIATPYPIATYLSKSHLSCDSLWFSFLERFSNTSCNSPILQKPVIREGDERKMLTLYDFSKAKKIFAEKRKRSYMIRYIGVVNVCRVPGSTWNALQIWMPYSLREVPVEINHFRSWK